MVYLIAMPEYLKEDSYDCTTWLKIGYTGDKNCKKRFENYKNVCRTCKILYTIPEATIQDETNLHYHFLKYRIDGREWYSKEKDILDYFATHTTKESLSDLPEYHFKRGDTPEKARKKKLLNLIANVKKLIFLFLIKSGFSSDNYIIEYEKLNQELNSKSISLDEQSDYIKSRYPDIDFSICENYKLSKEDKKLLKTYNTYTQFGDKMLFLITNKDKITIELLLSLPEEIRNYYCSFGPKKAKSLGYRHNEFKKEWNRILNNSLVSDSLGDRIYSSFEVGKRYTKAFIKEELGKIYEDLGYKSVPKANDLEKYFNIHPVTMPNKDNGKRENGFEIRKKLDD